jgi:hypothetical protein
MYKLFKAFYTFYHVQFLILNFSLIFFKGKLTQKKIIDIITWKFNFTFPLIITQKNLWLYKWPILQLLNNLSLLIDGALKTLKPYLFFWLKHILFIKSWFIYIQSYWKLVQNIFFKWESDVLINFILLLEIIHS